MSNPLIAPTVDSTKAYSGISLLEDANDLSTAIKSGDWASVAMGAVGTALDALSVAMDPFGAILAAGVGWLLEHVGPLKDALNALTGNADQIKAQSETWANVAKELGSVADDLNSAVMSDLQSWSGDASDAYRERARDMEELLKSAQQGCDGASSGVKTAGEVVAAVRTLVRDIISELVGHLISWALQVLATLGIAMTWVLPQVISTVAKTASQITSIVTKLVKALKALVPLLKKAGTLFESAGKALKGIKGGKVTSAGKSADVGPMPKDPPKPVNGSGGGTPKGGPDGSPPAKSGGDDGTHASSTGDDGTHTSGAGGDTPPPKNTSDPAPAPKDGDPGGGPVTPSSTPEGGGGTPKGGGGTPKGGDSTSPSSIKDGNTEPKQNSTPNECRPGSGDPIDMTTGRMMLTETDVEIGGVFPLVLTRTHLSTYRAGFRFGRTWASTVDQRLEVEDGEIGFAAEDGTLLTYPLPGEGTVLPLEGPHWPMTRSPEGGYVIEQPDLARMLYFTEDGAGRLPLTAMFDNDDHSISFCHDTLGNLTEIRDSGGTRIEVETSAGFVTALTLLGPGEGDRTELVRYRYNRELRLTEVVNSSGLPMRFGYDEHGRVVSWEDRNGRSYEFTYDELDRCVRGSGAGGHLAYTFAYDLEAGVNTATDSLGNTTEYHVNADFQIVREVDALGGVTAYEWDRFDRLLALTDPIGRTTRYEYDERGDVVRETRPDGTQRLTEYDDSHRIVSTVEPDGAVWRRQYDENGRLAASVGPLGATTHYRYDDHGVLSEHVDELGGRTRIECDPFGRALLVTNALGIRTSRSYDALGRIVTETDGLGGSARYSWTVEGGGWLRTAPDGSTLRRVFDGEGNVLEEADELGAVTRTDYGAFDLPVTEIGPDGARLRIEYDTELRMVSATNPEGLTWTFEYDALGRKVREQDFDGRVLTYRYDAADQLIERTNAAGETTTFGYDARGNVIEKQSGEFVSTFTYDAMDRMVRAVNRDADVSFVYDELGQKIAETCNGRTVASRYDAAGHRVHRRTPSGAESTWHFDAIGEPVALRAAAREIRFTYDAAGRETWRGLGPASLTQTWDAVDRLRTQTLGTGPSAITQQRAYDVRADGVVSRVEDLIDGGRDYTVDRSGRVTRIHGTAGVEQYAYDRSGNLATAQWPGNPETGPREYRGTLLLAAGGVAHQYDAQGRLVSRGGWRYAWNVDDRLVAVSTPDGQQWRYRYDALGRRVAKQRVEGGAVVAETWFVWDGDLLAEQLETGPGGDSRASTWDWNPHDGAPVSQTDRAFSGGQCVDERFYAIVTDFIGTPSELVDDAGRIAWHRHETLWGVPQAPVTGPSTPLRFPGQYLDPETGLHYNFHRYYDPHSARYLSADPLGLAGDLNGHGYVLNPVTWSDPFGLKGNCQENRKGKYKDKDKADRFDKKTGLKITDKGRTGVSPEGLHYDLQSRLPNKGSGAGANRSEKNRLDHVLLHADNDNPIAAKGGRPKGEHGVWGTPNGNVWETSKITKTIDQGWAKRGDPGVTVNRQDGGRTLYTIPMDKQLGYIPTKVKGPDGEFLKNPDGTFRMENKPLTQLQVVVEGDNNVITAYPFAG